MKHSLFIVLSLSLLAACGKTEEKAESTHDLHTGIVANDSIQNESYQIATSGIIVRNNRPTIVDFSASWCGPCQKLAPYFELWEEKYNNKINFVNIDVDSYPDIANKFKISSIPTIIVFNPKENIDDLPLSPQDVSTIILGFQPEETQNVIKKLVSGTNNKSLETEVENR